MTPGLEGFAKLGNVVAGAGQGPDTTSDAYLSTLGQAYRVQGAGASRDKARSEARIAQLRAIAREGLGEQAVEAGYTPFQATVLQSNSTVDLDQLGKTQLPGSVENLRLGEEALLEGNTAAYNDRRALALGLEREPFELAAGGKAVFRPETGTVNLTDLGLEELGAIAALATARKASAGASNARADLVQRTDPNRPRGKDKPEAPSADDMPSPQSAEEFAKLPPGTKFRAPDGSVRIKP